MVIEKAMAKLGFNLDELLLFFRAPIASVLQAGWACDESPWVIGFGANPIVAISTESSSTLLIGALTDQLVLKFVRSNDVFESIMDFEKSLCGNDVEASLVEKPVGLFDLGCVLCPLPDWPYLSVRKCSVIADLAMRSVYGFSVEFNLGIRMGFFVNQTPFLSFFFNDSCDDAMQQYESASAKGLVKIVVEDYYSSSGQLDQIDWTAWLG